MFARNHEQQESCDLDCLSNSVPTRIFPGPVKIVLIDIPTQEYIAKSFVAGLIGLAYLMIGFVSIYMLIYTFPSGRRSWLVDLHVCVFTFEFVLLLPMGVLMRNPLNGPTTILKDDHRLINHYAIQLVGAIVGLSTTVFFFLHMATTFEGHCIAGLVAVSLTVLTLLFGAVAAISCTGKAGGRCVIIVHRFLGILTLIAGSVCFGMALLETDLFQASNMRYMLLLFVGLSTIIVLIVPFMNCVGIKFEKD